MTTENRSLARMVKTGSLLFATSLLVLFPSIMAAHAQTSADMMRPTDLIDHPDRYLSQPVDLIIVEPLLGPTTPAELARTEYGQIPIRIPDSPGAEISLVPPAFQPADANRYRHKFDRVIRAPLRVRGAFLRDEEMSKLTRRPVYVIRAASLKPVDPGPAERVHSLADIKSDPARWDRKLVEYEGIYRSRFEVSALDREIWLSSYPAAEITGKSVATSQGKQESQVRVTGILFAKPGARYGHLGGYTFEIVASKIHFLAAAQERH